MKSKEIKTGHIYCDATRQIHKVLVIRRKGVQAGSPLRGYKWLNLRCFAWRMVEDLGFWRQRKDRN